MNLKFPIRKDHQDFIRKASEFIGLSYMTTFAKAVNHLSEARKDWRNKKSIEDFHINSNRAFYFGVKDYSERFWKKISIIVGDVKSVLDYGASIGNSLWYYKGDIYYYDISIKAKEFSKICFKDRNLNPIYLNNDEEVFSRNYDFIIFTNMVDLVRNPKELIEKLYKHLNLGGYFLFTDFRYTIGSDDLTLLKENYTQRSEIIDYIYKHFSLETYFKRRGITYYLYKKNENI